MLCVASDIKPNIGGKKAPPTIDITINDEPSFVSLPKPAMPNENMVGNMIDIKKETPIKA